MKVYFYTLGCKVNRYETQAMSEALKGRSFEITDNDDDADIYVINSCTVTAEADKKTRQTVRRFKRNNPDSTVVLTGCMPQAYPLDAEKLKEADIVLGNKTNCLLPDMIKKHIESGERIFCVDEHKTGDAYINTNISSFDGRTRADIKIQDGCNRFCTYCIIPTSRGRVRSKPIDELEKEIETVAESGYVEAVLVGINLSSYGSDTGLSIADAIEKVCENEKIKRVRLGSIEPDHLTDEVIERLSKCEKLCPQFHISLQSGCDKTLKNMHRHYNSEEYFSLCEKLRKSFKDCTLTTDVMVGFPGETDEDFSESLSFVKKVGFEKVHVFPYSARPGTKAAEYDGQVEKCIKEKRASVMIAETEKIRREFFNKQIGKTVNVLFESKESGGYIGGYTENYTPVRVKADESLYNKIVKVKIVSVSDGDFCSGEVII